MYRGDIKKVLKDFNLNEAGAHIIAYLALFIAFTAVGTYIYIPGPSSSYFNLGEVAIYIIAIVFGSKAGGISGAIGPALVDILLGYSIWAPFTFIIKGLEGFLVGKIAKKGSWSRNILAIVAGGNLMVIGYAVTKGFLISWAAVLPEIGIDYAQMLIGGIIALPIAFKINHYLDN